MSRREHDDARIAALLRRAKVAVAPDSFFLIGIQHKDWERLLENPEVSPSVSSPFMALKDAYEVTLLLVESDWRAMRHMLRDARVEADFRMLTFDVELDWNVVGFLARVTEILAEAGVSAGALSSFSRDHLLVKQNDLGTALRVLSPHVAELC